MKTWAIIVAGGSGQRFGGLKQIEYISTDSSLRVVELSISVARAAVDEIVLVSPSDLKIEATNVRHVAGGATRSGSVRCGLAAIGAASATDIVCVHDCVRPLASLSLYSSVIKALIEDETLSGAIPAIRVSDTITRVDTEGLAVESLDRAQLVQVQTPQAFRVGALQSALAQLDDATDDATLVTKLGGKVKVVEGELDNFKITHRSDLELAQLLYLNRIQPRRSVG